MVPLLLGEVLICATGCGTNSMGLQGRIVESEGYGGFCKDVLSLLGCYSLSALEPQVLIEMVCSAVSRHRNNEKVPHTQARLS